MLASVERLGHQIDHQSQHTYFLTQPAVNIAMNKIDI